jgi:hypothetical protein
MSVIESQEEDKDPHARSRTHLANILLAIGPKVRGFKPGRGRWILKGDRSSLERK